MRRLALLLAVIPALAACGSGGAKADLPPGQHDLGHGISVAVEGTKPVSEDVVAVDLEYFNRGDQPMPMGIAFAVELHDSNGRKAEHVSIEGQPGRTVPPHSSTRGLEAFKLAAGAKPAMVVLYGSDIGADAKPVTVTL